MKKTIFAAFLFLLLATGATKAQSQFQPVEGPIHGGGLQGQLNQAITFQGVVTVDGNEVLVVSLTGETFSLNNGHGLLQGNQINIGEVIWVTKASGQDFNSSRSNKEKG
ncbi:MAG: hypothetical protein U0176_00415 [Bacteroidia bacterium]